MTGIDPWKNNILDFPEQRYLKYKSTAEKYRIIQLGLCLWNKSDSNSYQALPYNIYMFPDDYSGNTQLNCETSAIIFNREHNMDFNKWIYKGVSYLNAKQESQLLEGLTDSNINFYDPCDKLKYKNITLYKDEDKKKYEEMCRLFSEFYNSEEKYFFFEKYPKFMIFYFLNNTPDHIRKRLYFSFETLEMKTVLMISKLTEEEKKFKLELELGEKMKELKVKKGIRNIFEALIKSKKILVGHNCCLDLLFTISHLGDPLPNSLKEYKDMLKSYFFAVYDTKFLYEKFLEQHRDSLNLESKITHLENVYTNLKSLYNDKICINLHPDFYQIYSEESKVYHEAAFDAYVTGSSFVWMGNVLQDDMNFVQDKIFFMKSIYSCFNISAEETYILKDIMPYCLKAVKQINDVDLSKLLHENFFKRIKKTYTLDSHNSILILVQLEDAM
jgi:poly(A)-specific ribonuclease